MNGSSGIIMSAAYQTYFVFHRTPCQMCIRDRSTADDKVTAPVNIRGIYVVLDKANAVESAPSEDRKSVV